MKYQLSTGFGIRKLTTVIAVQGRRQETKILKQCPSLPKYPAVFNFPLSKGNTTKTKEMIEASALVCLELATPLRVHEIRLKKVVRVFDQSD